MSARTAVLLIGILLVTPSIGSADSRGSFGNESVLIAQAESSLQFVGFSVRAPTGKDWTVPTNEQTPARAIFRRTLSYPHSFFASVELVIFDANRPFEQQVKSAKTGGEPTRFELLDYSQQMDQSRGTPCIRYSVRAIDKQARGASGVPLHLLTKGFICIHPTMTGKAVDAHYSERGLPIQLDPSLWKDLEEFLRGVQLGSAQRIPAS